MAEIIADNISIVETNELERFSRIDAEYYQPKYEKIIINFFHPFGAKFLSSCKWGCVVLLLRGLHPLLYANSPSGFKKV